MSPFFVIIYTISILYNTIYATTITCNADPSQSLYNLQFDHITTETYGGSESFTIGWKKVMYCDESISNGNIMYPTTTSSYMESLAPYAITVKIVPNDLNDPLFDTYAIYGKVCSNPIIALNNLYELSYTIDTNTFKPISQTTNINDWYGPTHRLIQDSDCPTNLETPLPITSSVFQSCGNPQNLHIYQTTNYGVCTWELSGGSSSSSDSDDDRTDKIAIYFGFDVNKQYMCDGMGNGGTQSVSATRRQLIAGMDGNLRRNLQLQEAESDYFDIETGELYNTPCMTIEIKLETENVLPMNNEPDAATNMIVIGKALGGDSSGILTMPEIFVDDFENDDWDIDPNCIDETQITDNYFPTDLIDEILDGTFVSDINGFTVTVPYTTPQSIVYIFEIDALPFTISHTCSIGISLAAEIYENGNLLDAADIISIPPHETGDNIHKLLPFGSPVQLLPGTDFNIIFTGNYFDNECTANNITIGSGIHRRRMQQDTAIDITWTDLVTNASPNSCLLGDGLAKSNAMKTAVTSMCNNDLGTYRSKIEAGLFKLHTQETAIRDFLVRPGSIQVYDENGAKIYENLDWPLLINNDFIKQPCIAIDENTNRVFSIGGYYKQTRLATDSIQVFQFSDGNDLSKGGSPMTELNGWVLDKPRYGSMCKYWKQNENNEYLIVISGMADEKYEDGDFGDKLKFFDDIRIFPIPKDSSDLNLWQQIHADNKKSKSLPETGTIKVAKPGVIDSRLFLYNNHILYFFGGKTHVKSKAFVSRFDLNDIIFETVNAASLATMQLTKLKSLPMIDETLINMGTIDDPEIKSCYMIFGGQSYENGVAVTITETGEPGLTFDILQLFCNPQIEVDGTISYDPILVERRRRLQSENIVTLSDFDKSMFDKSKNKRRLEEEIEEESQVFIRDFEYTLDGMWYDFNVKVEICFNNNDELELEEDFYLNSIIPSKNINGEEWIDYRHNIGDKILTESINSYIGWSNGFGAVNVYDLNILSVRNDACRPIITIYINEGCSATNIQLMDTNVMYMEVKFYKSLYDINNISDLNINTLKTQPTQGLEQIILDHSCNTDNNIVLSAAYDSHLIDLLPDNNNNENNNESDDDNQLSMLNTNVYFIISILVTYNVIISIIICRIIHYYKTSREKKLKHIIDNFDHVDISDTDSINV